MSKCLCNNYNPNENKLSKNMLISTSIMNRRYIIQENYKYINIIIRGDYKENMNILKFLGRYRYKKILDKLSNNMCLKPYILDNIRELYSLLVDVTLYESIINEESIVFKENKYYVFSSVYENYYFLDVNSKTYNLILYTENDNLYIEILDNTNKYDTIYIVKNDTVSILKLEYLYESKYRYDEIKCKTEDNYVPYTLSKVNDIIIGGFFSSTSFHFYIYDNTMFFNFTLNYSNKISINTEIIVDNQYNNLRYVTSFRLRITDNDQINTNAFIYKETDRYDTLYILPNILEDTFYDFPIKNYDKIPRFIENVELVYNEYRLNLKLQYIIPPDFRTQEILNSKSPPRTYQIIDVFKNNIKIDFNFTYEDYYLIFKE
jgi:hypothetical protein